uniref:Uncharacterized protein n=1 Tax=Anguilla anguilla TaxID=7936 RepID=A0A0E9X2C6_ANGAN
MGGGVCGDRVAYIMTRAQTPTWSAGDTPTLSGCVTCHMVCVCLWRDSRALKARVPCREG